MSTCAGTQKGVYKRMTTTVIVRHILFDIFNSSVRDGLVQTAPGFWAKRYCVVFFCYFLSICLLNSVVNYLKIFLILIQYFHDFLIQIGHFYFPCLNVFININAYLSR